jgi:regulator of protease activity HflC (stomatin/prohibitin superfamily)
MAYNETSSGLSLGAKIKIGGILFVLFATLIGFFGAVGKNLDQNWQVVQYPWGGVRIVNTPGYYGKWFGTVTTYPRNWQVEYNASKEGKGGDWATKVTFNDGGWAHMDSIIRFASPTTEPEQRAFHRLFAGSEENVEAAVWAHLADAMKSSGPVMSTSEHQSARRSEYNALVQEQLEKGLFEMKKTEKTLLDQTDDKGKPITVYATEVIVDKNGKPVVTKPSPLTGFGIKITQFSITDVRYDEQTVKQFVTKKEAFLAAENSKAQREKEVQERLMVQEKGLREKAEAEAAANKQKALETINAEREKIVAETNANREKVVAETNAARELAVAEMAKKQAQVKAEQEKAVAETAAQRELEVAKLAREAAEENAKKQIVLAEAQKKSLELAGAISERDRVLAEIAANRDVKVAEQLSKIATPSVIVTGGSADGKDDLTGKLVNIRLLEASGLLNQVNGAKK